MSYFLWGCRGILTLITLGSERVKLTIVCGSHGGAGSDVCHVRPLLRGVVGRTRQHQMLTVGRRYEPKLLPAWFTGLLSNASSHEVHNTCDGNYFVLWSYCTRGTNGRFERVIRMMLRRLKVLQKIGVCTKSQFTTTATSWLNCVCKLGTRNRNLFPTFTTRVRFLFIVTLMLYVFRSICNWQWTIGRTQRKDCLVFFSKMDHARAFFAFIR